MLQYFVIGMVLFLGVTVREIQGRASLIPKTRQAKSMETSFIVGGDEINITEAPHQVSLQTSKHFCGGSIISSQWILTAAHCTDSYSNHNVSDLKVRLGSSESGRGGELIQVAEIFQYQPFNYTTVDYDYSLLKLSKEIVFDDTKQAVKLPELNEVLDGNTCFVTGWGVTGTSSESGDSLRQAQVPIVNQDECSEKYKHFRNITDRMICAGYIEGGKDSCKGDSGGPLFTEARVLVGIVSWGVGCAYPNLPGVYARVSAVRDWIRTTSGV